MFLLNKQINKQINTCLQRCSFPNSLGQLPPVMTPLHGWPAAAAAAAAPVRRPQHDRAVHAPVPPPPPPGGTAQPPLPPRTGRVSSVRPSSASGSVGDDWWAIDVRAQALLVRRLEQCFCNWKIVLERLRNCTGLREKVASHGAQQFQRVPAGL